MKKISGALGMGGGAEDRPFIILEHFEPNFDIRRLLKALIIINHLRQ